MCLIAMYIIDMIRVIPVYHRTKKSLVKKLRKLRISRIRIIYSQVRYHIIKLVKYSIYKLFKLSLL